MSYTKGLRQNLLSAPVSGSHPTAGGGGGRPSQPRFRAKEKPERGAQAGGCTGMGSAPHAPHTQGGSPSVNEGQTVLAPRHSARTTQALPRPPSLPAHLPHCCPEQGPPTQTRSPHLGKQLAVRRPQSVADNAAAPATWLTPARAPPSYCDARILHAPGQMRPPPRSSPGLPIYHSLRLGGSHALGKQLLSCSPTLPGSGPPLSAVTHSPGASAGLGSPSQGTGRQK